MFGFRRSITNEECEVVALEGLLEGLNNHLNALIRINKSDSRYELDSEVKRVENEIKENEIKLKEMRTIVQFQQQQINRTD
jgi:hypothetical protein